MKRNKIIALGIVLAVIIIVIIVVIMMKGKKQEGYVFDRNSKISMKDVRIYLGKSDFNANDVKDYFKKDVINSYTLKYFLFLDDKFKDSRNPEELLQSVRDYLNTVMPPDEADKLFAVYKTYVYYQRDVHDKMSMWGRPTTPEEAIDYLHKLQDYRRKVFGDENADTLFGPTVMLQEYPIRRGVIIGNGRKNAELGECRRTPDEAEDALIFVALQPMRGDEFGRDRGFFGHAAIQAPVISAA